MRLSMLSNIIATLSLLYVSFHTLRVIVLLIVTREMYYGYTFPGTVIDVPNASALQHPSLDSGIYKNCKCDKRLFRILLAGPLDQADARLVDFTRKFLTPPSKRPYNLKKSEEDFTDWMFTDLVLEILENTGNYTANRFFVETSLRLLLNGTILSSTLFLEKHYSWRGVLFEPDQHSYNQLMKKHRKVWIAPVAASDTKYPHHIFIAQNPHDPRAEKRSWNTPPNLISAIQAQAFPLYTILLALNITTVDYLRIGHNSKEYEILKTIPYEKIEIKIISIEHPHDSRSFFPIKDFLEFQNYTFVTSTVRDDLENSLFGHLSIFN